MTEVRLTDWPKKPQRLAAVQGSGFVLPASDGSRVRPSSGDSIDLRMGAPDLPPPAHVVEALRRAALDPGGFRYAQRDTEAFRDAAAAWYNRRYGVSLCPETQILGLAGSQHGLTQVIIALTSPGDVVLVPDPGYPMFTAGSVLCGAHPYPYRLKAEDGYAFDPTSIPEAVWRKARLLFLNYPGNPHTGTASPRLFERAIEAAANYGVVIVHDSAYSDLTYDDYIAPSFLATPGGSEVGIEIGSLSKNFNLAGCRVGYAAGHSGVLRLLAEAKGHFDPGIFLPAQAAAVAAWTGSTAFITDLVDTYRTRRDLLVDALWDLGWPVALPSATLFVWAPVPTQATSLEFARELAHRTGVWVTPGTAFGPGGEGFVRFALVQPAERLLDAVQRIAASGLVGAVARNRTAGR